MPQIDREGIFKVAAGGQHGLEKADSGAVAVAIKFKITDKLEGNDWQDWSAYSYETWARLWIIGKDGNVNEKAIQTLRDILGWDGDLDSVGAERWQLPACQVNVKADTYDGKTKYKAEWINPIDYVPDSRPKSAPPETVQSLKNQFGAQIRACFGNRPLANTAPPAKAPPLPSPRAAATSTLPPPPAPKGVHGTKQRAWTAFVEHNGKLSNPHPDDGLGAQWARVYSQFFGGRDEQSLTPQDWVKMEQEGPAEITPF